MMSGIYQCKAMKTKSNLATEKLFREHSSPKSLHKQPHLAVQVWYCLTTQKQGPSHHVWWANSLVQEWGYKE